MGTMIQRLKLSDEQFRGERFSDHPTRSQGQQRSARADAARRHRRHPRAVPRSRRRHHRDQHVHRDDRSRRPTTASQSLAYEINVEGARVARRVADEWTARTPDRPRFVAGSIGPTNRTLSISPDVNNAAFRASTFDEMRAAYARAGARPDRRRRRPPAARDHLRHAERQGGARRHRGGVRRSAACGCR